MSKTLTNDQIKTVAESVGLTFAHLKAFAQVESRGKGFLANGEPVILFERHVFWDQLSKRGVKPTEYLPEYANVLNKTAGGYGLETAQHGRLQKAAEINREAALCSASWGLMQVMGFNWQIAGYSSLQEFINGMYKSEEEHLRACVNYLKACNLIKPLKEKNWVKVAVGYNGKGQAKHNYSGRLEAEYKKAGGV